MYAILVEFMNILEQFDILFSESFRSSKNHSDERLHERFCTYRTVMHYFYGKVIARFCKCNVIVEYIFLAKSTHVFGNIIIYSLAYYKR